MPSRSRRRPRRSKSGRRKKSKSVKRRSVRRQVRLRGGDTKEDLTTAISELRELLKNESISDEDRELATTRINAQETLLRIEKVTPSSFNIAKISIEQQIKELQDKYVTQASTQINQDIAGLKHQLLQAMVHYNYYAWLSVLTPERNAALKEIVTKSKEALKNNSTNEFTGILNEFKQFLTSEEEEQIKRKVNKIRYAAGAAGALGVGALAIHQYNKK